VWVGGCIALVAVVGTVVSGTGPIPAQERESPAARGKALVTQKGCYGCHTIGSVGTPIAPDLSRAAVRYRESDLARWLMDPSAQEPTRHMPPLELSETEARALAAYLVSLP
jgi:cytochrome c551/c552